LPDKSRTGTSVFSAIDIWDDHRPAHGEAKLVPLEGVASGKKIACVHFAVAQVVERSPMKLVRSGSGDDIHHASNAFAILRVEGAGLNAKLLHGIRIRIRLGDVRIAVVVI
jgi:hypothetical protein